MSRRAFMRTADLSQALVVMNRLAISFMTDIYVGRGGEWILQPEDPWEVTGYVPTVVFTCGAIAENDGSVTIYWGGADTVMCMGIARVNDLINLCLQAAPLYQL